MFQLDPSNPFHARVADRLKKDVVGWLTTITPDGVPQPNPVWFLWEGGDTIQIYSQDNHKIRNLGSNADVSFNLNSSHTGGDVVVLTGTAAIDENHPAAVDNPPYVEKYAGPIKHLGTDPAGFAASYHVPIILTITKLRGF